jgi:hypothetical protein
LVVSNGITVQTPELNASQVEKRVPEIAKYIIDNEDGYLFASITASYKSNVTFTPINGPEGNLGTVSMRRSPRRSK